MPPSRGRFQVVRLSTRYLKDVFKEFLPIWYKRSLGLTDELI